MWSQNSAYIPENLCYDTLPFAHALGQRRNSPACGSTDTAEMTVGDIRVHRVAPFIRRPTPNWRQATLGPSSAMHATLVTNALLYFSIVLHWLTQRIFFFFFTFSLKHRSRDSSAYMVTRVRVGQSRNTGSNPSNSSSTQAPIKEYGGGK